MSKLKSINTAIWSDPWFESISSEAKLLFLYLITNDHNNMLGIYELSERKISFETGISQDVIEEELKRFEESGKIKYTQNFVILINFLKHQKFNTNMKKSAIDVHNSLPESLKINGSHLDRKKIEASFETLCKGFGMVSKVKSNTNTNTNINLIERECDFSNTQQKKFSDFDKDSYFSVDELANIYVNDEELMGLVSKNTGKPVETLKNSMPDFVEKLKTENRSTDTPGEFAKYFRNIHKGNFKIKSAPSGKPSIEFAWEWSGQPKKYGTKEEYEADKRNFDQPGFGFKTLKSPEYVQ